MPSGEQGGEGTFSGQLSGDELSIKNIGHDTYGDTCGYIRTMSATRPATTKNWSDYDNDGFGTPNSVVNSA